MPKRGDLFYFLFLFIIVLIIIFQISTESFSNISNINGIITVVPPLNYSGYLDIAYNISDGIQETTSYAIALINPTPTTIPITIPTPTTTPTPTPICPVGYYCSGSLSTICPAGSYCLSGSQIPCAQGTYNGSTGASTCISCPTYTIPSNITGSINSSICKKPQITILFSGWPAVVSSNISALPKNPSLFTNLILAGNISPITPLAQSGLQGVNINGPAQNWFTAVQPFATNNISGTTLVNVSVIFSYNIKGGSAYSEPSTPVFRLDLYDSGNTSTAGDPQGSAGITNLGWWNSGAVWLNSAWSINATVSANNVSIINGLEIGFSCWANNISGSTVNGSMILTPLN